MMRQVTSPEQIINLSPTAKKKLEDWMEDKQYGSYLDGDFFPMTQLTIGQLFEIIYDFKLYDKEIKLDDNVINLVDILWGIIEEFLEQKN